MNAVDFRGATWQIMIQVTTIAKLLVPLGGQEIELQEIDYQVEAASAAPTLPLLRVRIREKSRFTVFEIDPATARAWGEALVRWHEKTAGGPPPAGAMR